MDQNDFEQKMINPDLRRTRIRRFYGSVIFLTLTVLFIVFYIFFYFSEKETIGNIANNPDEQLPGASTLSALFAAVGLEFSLLIATFFTSILSFAGVFFGYTSITYLPTRKMKIWAWIVTYTCLAICIVSFVFLLARFLL